MKTTVTQRRSILIALLVFACSMSFAAKTPVKNPKNQATKGTTQLQGANDHALFTHTYTLGKTAPINVTVDRAEYTVDQVSIDNGMFLTNRDQKFLMLHYTLHNPNRSDYGLAWSTLEIFGVDANNQNLRYVANVALEGTGAKCYMSLKPGQKVQLYTLIMMPAKGALPKLVIQSRDRLVLRYNLQEKDAKGKYLNPVKALPEPIADPADPTGATALETVPGQIGESYPLRDFDVKVDEVSFSDAPIMGKAPKPGERRFVAILTAKNGCTGDRSLAWNIFKPRLIDQDGSDVRWNESALFASKDEAVRGNLGPGQEMRVRYYYDVPADLALRSFTIQQAATGRVYAYDLSSLK